MPHAASLYTQARLCARLEWVKGVCGVDGPKHEALEQEAHELDGKRVGYGTNLGAPI